MIPKVYTTKKVIRITRPNQKSKELVFNNPAEDGVDNDLTINTYDLKMVSGSTLPTHRGARLDMALALWDRGVHKDNAAILRLTDLPNVDEIIKNSDALIAAENAVKQLQETVKILEGDKQTSDRELRHADRQIEKEKTKTKMDKLVSELKTATSVAINKLSGELKGESQSSGESKNKSQKGAKNA